MARRLRVHWQVPTTIVLSSLLGLVFAIGHHLFYASLTATSVNDGFFDQQQNLAIGNAFAFLVRAMLVISVGATYWQIFWHTLPRRDCTLRTVDALASLLTSVIDILSPRTWLASPLLVAIAATAWLIPIATIIPPATLTVHLISDVEYTLQSLATPDFLGVSMGQNVYQENDEVGTAMSVRSGIYNWNVYEGPTNYLGRVLSGTALDGELPKISAPATNASYVLSYPAPALRCLAMPVSVLSDWAPVMNCDPSLPFNGVANNFSACFTNLNDDYWWPYLAWAPGSNGTVPFPNGSLLMAGDLPLSSVPYASQVKLGAISAASAGYLGSYNSSAANLFIAPTHHPVGSSPNLTSFPLNCSLYNASHTVNFTFQEGSQIITVLDVNLTNPIAPLWTSTQRFRGENASADIGINMNYQALMDTLGRLLIGDIAREGTVYQTQILQTELAFTTEMWPIYTGGLYPQNGTGAIGSKWYQRPLAEAVEDLFQNMTLALFSRSDFLRASEDRLTNVTTTTLRNVYTYHWQRLWLAYGLAVGFTVIVVFLGCGSTLVAGASYSNKFSTTLRMTGGDRVDVAVKDVDRKGKDPLPEYLGEAKLLCGGKELEVSELENVSFKSGVTEHFVATRRSSAHEQDSLRSRM